MTTTVVALFKDTEDVNQAIGALKAKGIPQPQINVMARENVVSHTTDKEQVDQEVTEGMVAGAVSGASLGIFAGLAAGLSAVTIPGIGLVIAGSTLATLIGASAAGAGIGAVTGGALLAGLVKMGVADDDVDIYAEGLKRGGILVAVTIEPEQVETVSRIMYGTGAVSTDKLRDQLKGEGWQKFDEAKDPDESYPNLVIV